MGDLLQYLGKEIRLTFERDGREQGIRGMLREIKGEKLHIGGVWVKMPKYYRVEELEFKGA